MSLTIFLEITVSPSIPPNEQQGQTGGLWSAAVGLYINQTHQSFGTGVPYVLVCTWGTICRDMRVLFEAARICRDPAV